MPFHFVPPEYVRVTAEYSNAVLVAVLPHISDYCHRLGLPIETPVTIGQVASFGCSSDKNDPGGGVILTNGCIFGFGHGIIDTFVDRKRSFRSLEDGSRRSEFYGNVNMNKDEAIEFARSEIGRLGLSITDAFADVEPFLLTTPISYGTNVIPYYNIAWRDPRGVKSVSIEIDGNHRRLTSMELICSSLWLDPLTVANKPAEVKGSSVSTLPKGAPLKETNSTSTARPLMIEPKNTDASLSKMLIIVSDCAKKLSTTISLPITTNQIDEFVPSLHRIFLTNEYEFAYKDGYVTDFKAPDTFFVGPLKAHVQRYWGAWNMNEGEAIDLARLTLGKLGYWPRPYFYEKEPDNVTRALNIGDRTVPRFLISWKCIDSDKSAPDQFILKASASIEIDAGTKTVKSFHVFTSELPKATHIHE